MSGSGREALPNVCEWSGGLPGCPGVVGRPSRMFERGLEALPNVWGDQGPSRMSRSGRKFLPNVREWSGVSPGCPRVVGRRSQMSVSDHKA